MGYENKTHELNNVRTEVIDEISRLAVRLQDLAFEVKFNHDGVITEDLLKAGIRVFNMCRGLSNIDSVVGELITAYKPSPTETASSTQQEKPCDSPSS